MKKILIIGAGEGGRRLIGEIKRRNDGEILGILDDSVKFAGKNILGVKVVGKINDLAKINRKTPVDEVIIAIPSLRGNRLARIVDLIQKNKLSFKILPGIYESIRFLTSGLVPPGTLREVEISDLLEREVIKLELEPIKNYLKDKTVLVLGAGGSIGAEIAKQIIQFDLKQLILLDIYENSLYELEYELRYSNYETVIADIKDKRDMDKIFKKYRPDVIFHAAAHKHVPLMEKDPREAIKNNVLGSSNVINLAIKYKAEKFVFISTDKAINPSSVMGATKRFTEEQILALNCKQPIFAIVRFGNVLGSHGSVIRLWQKQLERHEPLTVTDKRMKRFFMTIPEAVQLVLQAGAMAEKSEIYILKMGKQYKIVDLASNLLKLSGIAPSNKNIVFTKIRSGEKISEVLKEKDESLSPSSHKLILKIKPAKRFSAKKIEASLQIFEKNIDKFSNHELLKEVRKIVTGYKPLVQVK